MFHELPTLSSLLPRMTRTTPSGQYVSISLDHLMSSSKVTREVIS